MREWGKEHVRRILFWLAMIALARFTPKIIAIAGSTNKRTTKNAILASLSPTSNVRADPKSYNTEIGLPLAVLGLSSGRSSVVAWIAVIARAVAVACFSRNFPKTLLLELGVDQTGDMSYLLRLVAPRILVLTNILDGSLIEEYALALTRLPTNGCAILNGDDGRIAMIAQNAPCLVLTYGQGEHCDFRLTELKQSNEGMSAILKNTIAGFIEPLRTARYGIHHLYAAASAVALNQFLEPHTV